MDTTATFSNRSNAKRAAEKMIANGTAPAVDYRFKTRDDGVRALHDAVNAASLTAVERARGAIRAVLQIWLAPE
jgi:hypothetical protein